MSEQISQPKVTLNILGANNAVANAAQKVLFLGPKTAAGSATSGELQETVTDAQINSLFGARSMLGHWLRAFKNINKVSQVDVIALDDNAGGVAATGSFLLTGTATEDGTLTFNVGSRQSNTYPISVSDTDTADTVGTALAAAITADTDAPFTAANSSGIVTVTAANDGTLGNAIGLEMSGSVAGISNALTAMNGGATDPDLTNVFDPIDGVRYQTIIYPSAYAIATINSLMTARFNVNNKVLDGMVIMSETASRANLVSTYNSENEKQIYVIGNRPVNDTQYKGSSLFELAGTISAQFAAIRALRLTDGESIAAFTIAGAQGARDSFGGAAIASLPYFNTPFANMPIIDTGKGFTDADVALLLAAGVSVVGNNIAKNSIIAGEAVTLYKTDSASNPDVSFKYLNYVDTMSGIREYFFNNLKSRFAQSRLTTGAILPRRNMANESVIRGFCVKLYNDLAGENFVLTQAGETALTFYKNNLSITLDLANRKVTLTMKTPIVTQLGEFTGSIQLSFSTN